jgi:hypothetical protein
VGVTLEHSQNIWILREIQKFACDSLPIGENRMKKFQSVPKIQEGAAFAPRAVYVPKKQPAVRGLTQL